MFFKNYVTKIEISNVYLVKIPKICLNDNHLKTIYTNENILFKIYLDKLISNINPMQILFEILGFFTNMLKKKDLKNLFSIMIKYYFSMTQFMKMHCLQNIHLMFKKTYSSIFFLNFV